MGGGLYTSAGWVNMGAVLDMDSPFVFGWGARGIGKTYGALLELYRRGVKFALMRNTQSESDYLLSEAGNPFGQINHDTGVHVGAKRINKYMGAFYNCVDTGEAFEPAGDVLGYILSLSTIGHVRGAGRFDIDVLFFDEFIPEEHLRNMRGMGEAFLNAIETLGRNRELLGKPPLKVVCMANSNRIDNDIFLELGLVSQAYKMQAGGVERWTDSSRGLTLINFNESPIAQKKKDTALYRLSGSQGRFYEMAIDNSFGYDDARVKSKNLRNYDRLFNIGELDIYQAKDGHGYYVRPAKVVGRDYASTEYGLKSARYHYAWLHGAWLDGRVTFENVLSSILFEKYFA